MPSGAAVLSIGISAAVGALAGLGLASLARSKHEGVYAAAGALFLGGNTAYLVSQINAANTQLTTSATTSTPAVASPLVPNITPTPVNAATPASST